MQTQMVTMVIGKSAMTAEMEQTADLATMRLHPLCQVSHVTHVYLPSNFHLEAFVGTVME